MCADPEEIREKATPVSSYIEALEEPFKERFQLRRRDYHLTEQAVADLRKLYSDYFIVAFSATWCKDCAVHIPVLDLLARATGLRIYVFGGIKRDPLSHARKWRIPPSPPEVEAFGIDKLPTIIVFNARGFEVGRIVENLKVMPTLEEEVSEIIGSHLSRSSFSK